MNVRIGIADASREVELEVENPADLEAEIAKAFGNDTLIFWVTDTEGHRIGIPIARIAYVEIISEARPSVGFG